jgi:CHAT domain-containing protein/tetratricopeptide (TPR) repeat protein
MLKTRGLPALFFSEKMIYYLALLLAALEISCLPVITFTATIPQASYPASSFRTAEQVTEEAEDLALDKFIQRDIDEGKTHLYRIILASNQYIQATIKSLQTEMEFAFYDPGHKKVLEIKCRPVWPMEFSFISSTSGTYTLGVRSVGTNVSKGGYELRVNQLRRSSERDRDLIISESAIVEAEKLRNEWKSESLLKAINKYELAYKYLAYANDASGQAYMLKNIADVYFIMGDNQKALRYYDQVLPLIRKKGDPRLEVEALNDLACISIELGFKDKAFNYWSEGKAISKEIGYIRGEALSLNNKGVYYSYLLGDKKKALEFFNQSLGMLQSEGDARCQAQVHMNLGYALADLGEVKTSLSHFTHALDLWQLAKDRRGEALALTAIGLADSSVGETQSAIENHTKAAQILRILGDRIGQAVTLNAQAYVFVTLGEIPKALDLYNQALKLYQSAGRPAGEAVTLGQIAELYVLQDERERALYLLSRKLAISRSLNNRRIEAYTLNDMGIVFDSLGDKDKALNYYQHAYAISESIPDPRSQAYSLNSIGYVYERSGKKQQASDQYKKALAFLRSAEDRIGETQTLHNLARTARDLGKLKEAYDYSSVLVKIIETLRTRVASQELRTSYFASVRQHYEIHIDILMQMHRKDPSAGFDYAALEASEKARSRSLLDLLNQASIDIRQGVEPALLQQEHDLQQLLNSKAERQVNLLSRSHTEEQGAEMAKEITDITSQYEDVLAKIRSSSPRYATLMQASTLSLSGIRQNILDSNTLFLEYLLGDEHSYLWAVSENSINSYELPARSEIEGQARSLYDCLASFSQIPEGLSNQQVRRHQERIEARYPKIASELSQTLLNPIASGLGTKRLVIVADGGLQYVPFAALPAPDNEELQPLVLNHEIISLPSLSVLAVLRNEISGRAPATKTLAILADPVYEHDDPRVDLRRAASKRKADFNILNKTKKRIPSLSGYLRGQSVPSEKLHFQRLPSAWREATALAKLVPEQESKLALGFEADLSLATSAELRQYRIVHFATHGIIYGMHPQLYGIVLSLVDKEGRSQDGFLRLNEIYNLKLPVDLVVLSACQTALGKEIKGEGLVGLTRGFMYAGAARIVASLWKVDDKASAELMESFYEAVLRQRMTPSAALRAAQVAMWKNPRWKFPFYWAAFVLQGEWK